MLHFFLDEWLEQFHREEQNYRSITVQAEVGFSEIEKLTCHVISKKLLWFSFWYSGSPQTTLRSTFAEWKRWHGFHMNQRMMQSLLEDCQKVASAQKNVAMLTETNDTLQEEFASLLDDNTSLYDNVQLLSYQIENAKRFVQSTLEREELVCFDGQLRMEVVSEVGYFILESLLRSQYNLGFHQRIIGPFSEDSSCLEQFFSYVLKIPATNPLSVPELTWESFITFLIELENFLRQNNIKFNIDDTLATKSSSQYDILLFHEWSTTCVFQQEHYIASPTLFFARHFEDHEISVYPTRDSASSPRTLGLQQNTTRHPSLSSVQSLLNLEKLQSSDLDLFSTHWQVLLVGRCFQEYGSLIFHQSDMSPYFHNWCISELLQKQKKIAKVTKPKASKKRITESGKEDRVKEQLIDHLPMRASRCIVNAYNLWTSICSDLCVATVVEVNSTSPAVHMTRSPSKQTLTSNRSASAVGRQDQPNLRMEKAPHFELSSTSIYLSGGPQASKKYGTFETSKLRSCDVYRVVELKRNIDELHDIVLRNWEKNKEVDATKAAMTHARLAMWNTACVLAQEKERMNTPLSSHTVSKDVRPSLFQVITWESKGICDIIQKEVDPESEMENVRRSFQVNDLYFRMLYAKAETGLDISHALTVEELWHTMKKLRVCTKVIPASLHDESVDHQVISVEEFAEIVLKICNEQFGEMTRLGQRVDRFVVEYLSSLQKPKSALHEEAQTTAMKSVLSEFKNTLHTIFKRFASKPRSKEKSVMHMKLRDWLGFIKEYKLVTTQFTSGLAQELFRSVQYEDSQEDELEMVFAEFCDAIIALAGFICHHLLITHTPAPVYRPLILNSANYLLGFALRCQAVCRPLCCVGLCCLELLFAMCASHL
ncbi:hypothetical protein Ae201684_003449 [Aphanomyces euteiches]|uniref:Uncharacterized protein n=1 Tax=Aphanomyces euteiches TaxID=100861 RepID=A0A6G0XM83_9STRA|nr:hypothetical protein Ae201684_003449 [Aphanomyces euteiches]